MKKVFIFLVLLLFSVFVSATDKVEINTASLEQLEEITGVGPVIAQRIIDARPFSSVDDLLRVKGIGEKTLQKIKDQGLAYVGEKSKILNSKSEINSNEKNLNIQNTAEQPGDVVLPAGSPTSGAEGAASPTITYPNGIIFNEILPSPKGADEENEWIELYNTNNFEVDLSGWKIKDKEGTTTNYFLSENTKISAYGYLVFKRPDTKITLNNTIDGLSLYWPNEKIIDSINYEKSPSNQSYNKIGKNWQWSASLTPDTKNIIAQNNAGYEPKNLSKIENSGNNKETDKGLVVIGQQINGQENIKNTNPWFLFLIALSITIISAIIVLFIKFKINNHVGT